MDRFDLTRWKLVEHRTLNGGFTKFPARGYMAIRASNVANLWIFNENGENGVFYNTGRFLEFHSVAPCQFHVEAPSDVKVFIYSEPAPTTFEDSPNDPRYVNVDKMPDESGQVAEVQRALRLLRLERDAILQEARALAPGYVPDPVINSDDENAHGANS